MLRMNMQCIENQNLGSIDMKKYIYEKQLSICQSVYIDNISYIAIPASLFLNDIYHLFNGIMRRHINYPMTRQINTAIND